MDEAAHELLKLGLAEAEDRQLTKTLELPFVETAKKIIGYEAWEDGNVVNGDGCSSTCTIETGYSWSGGTISSVDICTLKCGDGKKFPSEFCDDGNLDNNDGWSSTCKVETGFTCIDGDTNNRDICSEVCGDGIVYVDTATNWDDGNLLDGDGCSHDWLVEYGYTWNGGTPSSPDVCKAKCGDGILLSNVEQCDDGNIKIGDGCDTYQCIGGISTSADADHCCTLCRTSQALRQATQLKCRLAMQWNKRQYRWTIFRSRSVRLILSTSAGLQVIRTQQR